MTDSDNAIEQQQALLGALVEKAQRDLEGLEQVAKARRKKVSFSENLHELLTEVRINAVTNRVDSLSAENLAQYATRSSIVFNLIENYESKLENETKSSRSLGQLVQYHDFRDITAELKGSIDKILSAIGHLANMVLISDHASINIVDFKSVFQTDVFQFNGGVIYRIPRSSEAQFDPHQETLFEIAKLEFSELKEFVRLWNISSQMQRRLLEICDAYTTDLNNFAPIRVGALSYWIKTSFKLLENELEDGSYSKIVAAFLVQDSLLSTFREWQIVESNNIKSIEQRYLVNDLKQLCEKIIEANANNYDLISKPVRDEFETMGHELESGDSATKHNTTGGRTVYFLYVLNLITKVYDVGMRLVTRAGMAVFDDVRRTLTKRASEELLRSVRRWVSTTYDVVQTHLSQYLNYEWLARTARKLLDLLS